MIKYIFIRDHPKKYSFTKDKKNNYALWYKIELTKAADWLIDWLLTYHAIYAYFTLLYLK